MLDIFEKYDILGAFWMTIKLTVLLGDRRPRHRHRAGGDAGVAGGDPATSGLVLRQHGAQHPADAHRLLLLAGPYYILQISLTDVNSPTSLVDNGIRWAIVALAVYHAAFVCEALRSGVNTVPLGQAEAARSIGLTFGQSLREVILPAGLPRVHRPAGLGAHRPDQEHDRRLRHRRRRGLRR